MRFISAQFKWKMANFHYNIRQHPVLVDGWYESKNHLNLITFFPFILCQRNFQRPGHGHKRNAIHSFPSTFICGWTASTFVVVVVVYFLSSTTMLQVIYHSGLMKKWERKNIDKSERRTQCGNKRLAHVLYAKSKKNGKTMRKHAKNPQLLVELEIQHRRDKYQKENKENVSRSAL